MRARYELGNERMTDRSHHESSRKSDGQTLDEQRLFKFAQTKPPACLQQQARNKLCATSEPAKIPSAHVRFYGRGLCVLLALNSNVMKRHSCIIGRLLQRMVGDMPGSGARRGCSAYSCAHPAPNSSAGFALAW